MPTDQFDLFSTNEPIHQAPICLQEHSSDKYGPRTAENAKKADLTVALATDFTTMGEKLTAKVSEGKYIGISWDAEPAEAADQILKSIREFVGSKKQITLNIAGNGLYTFRKGTSQAQINQKVYDILKLVHASRPLYAIRSGGQTGVDTAGLVAGLGLNIPVCGLYPKGYRQRQVTGVDTVTSAEKLEQELLEYADCLKK